MEDALYDIESMRRFVDLKLASDAIPDETTLLNFRHLLEKHQLTESLFKEINTYLDEKKLNMKRGTIVDATLIPAPSSTKNKDKSRDPEMSSTKKGHQWHFGMKAHIGVDMEDALYDIESMRRFVKLKLASDAIPDETTLLNFRHLLEKHQVTESLFKAINTYLDEKKLNMKRGTIVGADLIAAPSSTKNKDKSRDPEMSSTKKGHQWHFGMKAHIGVDADLVHSMSTTTSKTHKVEMEKLLQGKERAVFGDKGYVSDKDKRQSREDGVYRGILDKAKPKKKLSATQKKRNRKHASIRAKVEHPFRVIKHQFGYIKTPYRGLAKNTAQLYSLFARECSIFCVRGYGSLFRLGRWIAPYPAFKNIAN